MKRHLILVSIVVSLIAGYAFSEDMTGVFNSANSLYQEGKYEEALGEYNQCVSMGYVSGNMYYNMGNCYFKLGVIGKTILYYEKAKKLIPGDPELVFNLQYVYSMLKDDLSFPKNNWFLRKLVKITEIMNVEQWALCIIALWAMLITCGFICVFIRTAREKIFKIVLIISMLLVVAVPSVVRLFVKYSISEAIVLAPEIPVRYGPGEGEVEAFVLHEGAKVMVHKEQKDWVHVQIPNGTSGWVKKGYIGEI